MSRRLLNRVVPLIALVASVLLLHAAPALAGPLWRIDSVANSTVPTATSATVLTATDGSASTATDEVQHVTVAAGAGQFRLSFAGESTSDIAARATASAVQARLGELTSIGEGNVQVTGGPASAYGTRPYIVLFQAALGAQDVGQLSIEDGAEPLVPAITYSVQVTNVGDTPASGAGPDLEPGTGDDTPVELSATLPDGFHAIAAVNAPSPGEPFVCPPVSGETTFSCATTHVFERARRRTLRVTALVDPAAQGFPTAVFSVSGAAAASATTADPVEISSTPPAFGVDGFRMDATDTAGNLFSQAAGHPDLTTTGIDFHIVDAPLGVRGFDPDNWPAGSARNVLVDLPPGFLGNVSSAPRCSLADFTHPHEQIIPAPLCLPESQLGSAAIRIASSGGSTIRRLSLFNLVPPPGVPARFGFNVLNNPVILDAEVRNGSDYGLTIASNYISEGLPLIGTEVEFWGVPASPVRDPDRGCPGRQIGDGGESCDSLASPVPVLRNPTSCTEPGQGLLTTLRSDSWQHPGDFIERSFTSHTGLGFPWPEEDGGTRIWGARKGTDGCGKVPFAPAVEASATTESADSPSGLDLHLRLPQNCWEHAEDICQSDLRDAVVTLPRGMTLNPAAASGISACSAAQIGYLPGTEAPYEFSPDRASCPAASKIGSVEVTTPLLARFDSAGNPSLDPNGVPVPDPIEGSVYLAAQKDNPAGSLLGFYFLAEGHGVRLKQFGEIRADPTSGRLTTVFHETPQQPFSELRLSIFGGSRAPLRTPPDCGTYAVRGTFTPWSGNADVHADAGFEITSGPSGSPCPNSGFDPQLEAGTQNPLAGATSPFGLRLTRTDGTEALAGLRATMPPGLSGYLAGIPYCPDATLAAISSTPGTGVGEEASPSCPAASRIGRLVVGAGAGPTPFYTSSGRVYLAGPYRGAPLSLAVVAPAVAGPFDLGTALVRNAVHIDPATTVLTVESDPFPTTLHGIPLDLRDVRVEVDRDHFILNPTSCEEMAVGATISSATGQSAKRSSRFQLGGCDRLGFKPKLSFAFKGAVHRRTHPSLTAVYRARPGDANLARAQVKLPPAAFLDNAHIGTICTRVQFAAHACPEGSIYGKAQATSPILGYPLYGNVYLRSSDNKLPDLVADLRGPDTQPIEVALSGSTDSVKGALRNTFDLVPDAPVTEFRLTLFGKSKGLIIMSSGFCANPRATVKLDAHNGKTRDTNPVVRSKCGKPGKGKRKK